MNSFLERYSDRKPTSKTGRNSQTEQSIENHKSSTITELEHDERMNLLSKSLRILSQKTKDKYEKREEKRSSKARKPPPKSPRNSLYNQQELLLTIENLTKENNFLRNQLENKDKKYDDLHLKFVRLKQKLSMDRVKRNSYGPIQEFKKKPNSFRGYFKSKETRKSRNSNPVKPNYYTSFNDNFEPEQEENYSEKKKFLKKKNLLKTKGFFHNREKLGGVFETLSHLKSEIKNLKKQTNQVKSEKNIDKLIKELRITRKRNEEMCKRLSNYTAKGYLENFNSRVNQLFYGSVSQNVQLIDQMKVEYESLIGKMDELEDYCLKVKAENSKLRKTGNHFSQSTANFRFHADDDSNDMDHGY